MRRYASIFLAMFLLSPPADLQAQALGGFLSAYRPAPNARAAFYEGYGRHLDWHRQAGDTLTWYAWDVLVGPGQGLFVDGMFGSPLAALDERVDPAGDAQDNAANVESHGTAAYRELLLLRPELSSATPLEEGNPTPLVQVVWYGGRPPSLGAVERGLHRLASSENLLPYTVYENVSGGSAPGFLLMIWRDRLGSFGENATNPEKALRQFLAAEGMPSPTVASELWLYRRDLTYFGGSVRGP